MHPLDLSPTTSSLANRSLDVAPSVSIRDLGDSQINSKPSSVSKKEKDQGKRGRPRADVLTALMVEGSSSRSRIRCNKCGRAFPREKSLQAHLRTHTGERPYTCDFPGCAKAFCQSGQLKTHQRLHTKEKPFACIAEGCKSRFTHANRHCTSHPCMGVKRMDLDLAYVVEVCENEQNPAIKMWLTKYIKHHQERGNPKPPFKKVSSEENMDNEVLKIVPVNGSVIRSLSLPRIPSSPSLTTLNMPSPSPPQLMSIPTSPASFPPNLFSIPPILTPQIPRLSSASSTGSSSSGVSSMSSLSSASTSSLPSHQDVASDTVHGVQNFIYSSQMILQGQYNECFQQLNTGTSAKRNISPAAMEPVPMDYRVLPSSSPQHMMLCKSPSPTMLAKSPTWECKTPMSVLPSKSSPPILKAESTNPEIPIRTPSPTETTSSIRYRTTPKNREKDRYISALALIELSKG